MGAEPPPPPASTRKVTPFINRVRYYQNRQKKTSTSSFYRAVFETAAAEWRFSSIPVVKLSSFLWPESKASTCSQVYCCCCCCWTALRRRQQQLSRHLRKANLGATRFRRIQRDRCPSRDCRSRSPVAGLFGPFHRRLSTGAERFLDRFAQTHGGQQSGLCLFVRRPFRSSVPRSRLGRSLEVES